jgi:hypothetical protein
MMPLDGAIWRYGFDGVRVSANSETAVLVRLVTFWAKPHQAVAAATLPGETTVGDHGSNTFERGPWRFGPDSEMNPLELSVRYSRPANLGYFSDYRNLP